MLGRTLLSCNMLPYRMLCTAGPCHVDTAVSCSALSCPAPGKTYPCRYPAHTAPQSCYAIPHPKCALPRCVCSAVLCYSSRHICIIKLATMPDYQQTVHLPSVLPCPALSTPALPCPAKTCPAKTCPARPVLPCPAMPCPAMPCYAMPCCAMLCSTSSAVLCNP